MKKQLGWLAASMILLSACTPNSETEVVQDPEESEARTVVLPSVRLDDNYYSTILPYAESKSRGLVVSNMATKYDIVEVEKGLMRLSQNEFPTDQFFFQEGQYLDRTTISSWLARSNQTEQGLNPDDQGLTGREKAQQAPVYLSHIVEQNYLVLDENTMKLAGISIGLALNSIYYYTEVDYGPVFEQQLSDTQITENGRRIAQEIVTRMRAMPGLEEIPITIGLFKQNSRNAIVPGTYFSYGVSDSGNEIGDWSAINERFVTFPTSDSSEQFRDTDTAFRNFKQDVETYFPNYTSVIGNGFYKDDFLQKLTIDIPIQFFGKAEIIGFTQYVSGLINTHFVTDLPVEINITSIEGEQALIKREANQETPFVHIYE
ncbi:CamS family sex pheromone protein [Chryseomicrobium sp. FSL W7-1435]|uniref:CamS family sex pheromone protein n=1 Tax=Chryseomicrobium sp. FSL W7-1435 TaxID=2921704 RepID=UPI00315AC4AB